MTAAPPLPHKHGNSYDDYAFRNSLWHLRELGDIVKAARRGVPVDVRACLGKAVRGP